MLGNAGLTDGVVNELDRALERPRARQGERPGRRAGRARRRPGRTGAPHLGGHRAAHRTCRRVLPPRRGPSEGSPSRPLAERPGTRRYRAIAETPCQAPKREPGGRPVRAGRLHEALQHPFVHAPAAPPRRTPRPSGFCPAAASASAATASAEIGLDAEQARRQQARQVPVALGVEQGRRHPGGERPEAPGPQHQQHAKAGYEPAAQRASNVADGHDLVALGAAGRRHVHHVALRLADERARDRRGDREQAVLDVRLVVADQLVDELRAAVLVLELRPSSRTPRARSRSAWSRR